MGMTAATMSRVLELACTTDFVHLFPHQHLMVLYWQPGISHGGRIYTVEIGKCYQFTNERETFYMGEKHIIVTLHSPKTS